MLLCPECTPSIVSILKAGCISVKPGGPVLFHLLKLLVPLADFSARFRSSRHCERLFRFYS